jgi:hypothetical protein
MNLRDEINPPVMRTVPCCLSNDQSMATGFSSEIGELKIRLQAMEQ